MSWVDALVLRAAVESLRNEARSLEAQLIACDCGEACGCEECQARIERWSEIADELDHLDEPMRADGGADGPN